MAKIASRKGLELSTDQRISISHLNTSKPRINKRGHTFNCFLGYQLAVNVKIDRLATPAEFAHTVKWYDGLWPSFTSEYKLGLLNNTSIGHRRNAAQHGCDLRRRYYGR